MQQAVYFIFCLLLMSVPASYEGNIGARDFAPVLMSIAGVQSVFFSVIFCLLAKYLGKTVKYGIAFILLLLFIIETYTYIQFGSRFNSLILSLLLQTNIQEIKEFFSLYIFSPFTLFFLILVISGCYLFYKLDIYWDKKYSFQTGKIIDMIIFVISIVGVYGSIYI
jgi:glucan phosphoethanolaminetransferase (alkaline phosphatase superfamily)